MGRLDRVTEQLKVEVSAILREEIKDPRVGFITVMRTSMSADLQHAHIYVSVLGTTAQQERALKALTSASGFVRKLVGDRIRLRYTPELTFHLDRSLDDQFRIQAALDRLHKETPPNDTASH